jgi:hypothetical protein
MRRVSNHLRNIAASITCGKPEPVAEIRALKEQIRIGVAEDAQDR